MFADKVFILLFLFSLINCDVNKKSSDKNLFGIKTLHTKINKNTKFSTNMLQDTGHRGKKAKNVGEKQVNPDWSYSSFPPDVTDHVTQFKRNMTECLKEVQANEKRIVRQLSPRMDSPIHGECLIACVLKRNGVIKNGKIYKDNLFALVYKFFAKDDKLMKKLERNLDRCIDISSRVKDECEIAARLNDCTNELMTINKNKLVINY